MKARAARTRDIDDLRLLADIIGVNSADEALRICEDSTRTNPSRPDRPLCSMSFSIDLLPRREGCQFDQSAGNVILGTMTRAHGCPELRADGVGSGQPGITGVLTELRPRAPQVTIGCHFSSNTGTKNRGPYWI